MVSAHKHGIAARVNVISEHKYSIAAQGNGILVIYINRNKNSQFINTFALQNFF
jgi:hypothetical protein